MNIITLLSLNSSTKYHRYSITGMMKPSPAFSLQKKALSLHSMAYVYVFLLFDLCKLSFFLLLYFIRTLTTTHSPIFRIFLLISFLVYSIFLWYKWYFFLIFFKSFYDDGLLYYKHRHYIICMHIQDRDRSIQLRIVLP